ncbi:MAG: helix-turn-helix domain-containing protein [Candidatus Microbacterium colombiense]|nr:MAG: helix-turn-helix domain-containing protein [Microbacterium sp.]
MSAHNDTPAGRIAGRNLDDLPDLLTIKELSEWAQIPVSTLYQWNLKEIGPRPMKFGKHLRYSREVLRLWMESLDRHDWSSVA